MLRSFILALFVTASYAAKEAVPDDADVLIIGAGWSGMAAAVELAKKNVSFIVLEARDHTGGRTHAIQFGNPDVWRGTVEEGSNWVCGVNRKADAPLDQWQPVHELAKSMSASGQEGDYAGFATVRIPGSSQNMNNYAGLFNQDMTDADADGTKRAHANAVYDCLNDTATTKGKDVTMTQGLEDCGWSAETSAELALQWALVTDDPGLPVSEISVKGQLPDPTYMWWGDDDNFVVDQSPRGFARVLDEMTAPYQAAIDEAMRLGAEVTKLQYDTGGVTAVTADGRSFHAPVALATFPLGHLQRTYKTLFEPALDRSHIKALTKDDFVMANLTHVLIQFDEAFWPDLPRFLVADDDHDTTGFFVEFQNMDHLIPGSKTLLSFLGDPWSSELEAMDDAAVQALLLARVRAIWPAAAAGKEPTAFFLSRWGQDPLAGGAYSGYVQDTVSSAGKAVSNPLYDEHGNERVYFAGEHTCSNLSGYTHGALLSGRHRAQVLLHKYFGFKSPSGPSPCNYWPYNY